MKNIHSIANSASLQLWTIYFKITQLLHWQTTTSFHYPKLVKWFYFSTNHRFLIIIGFSVPTLIPPMEAEY